MEIVEENTDRADSGQGLNESHDIFESSNTTMEVEVDKTQEQSDLGESEIELNTTNEAINLNETTDTRDSLEDKLSQMEGQRSTINMSVKMIKF